MKITYKDIYTTYLQLVLHSESISWSRFNNFLIINSILVLAWATIFTSSKNTLWAEIVMYAICVLGILTTIAWADLGERGRRYLDSYKDKAKNIEAHYDKAGWWENNIQITDRPCQIDIKPRWYSSSHFLLRWGPFFFILIYGILVLATINGWNPLMNN